jgi:CDP-glucose 4,6-dehydratase
MLRAFETRTPALIRNPRATRPWQHVLEPLSAYLKLAQALVLDGQVHAEGWNFGPHDVDAREVGWIADELVSRWGRAASWRADDSVHPHEAHYLKLDISKARSRLGWQPAWTLSQALDHIVDWHQAWMAGSDMRAFCLSQVAGYGLAQSQVGPSGQ